MEGPAVVLTREEWEREFLTSQVEYLSSVPMLSLGSRRKSHVCLSGLDMKLLLRSCLKQIIYSFIMNYFTMVGRRPGESQAVREAIRHGA